MGRLRDICLLMSQLWSPDVIHTDASVQGKELRYMSNQNGKTEVQEQTQV